MILIIDNYDSFSHNLAQAFGVLGCTVRVERNDALSAVEAIQLEPDGIVISPGPGTPAQAGISVELIQRVGGKIPLAGVCLGHQCIAAAFGGRIRRSPRPTHGKISHIRLDMQGLFSGLPKTIQAARYHSLTVDEPSLPGCFDITARTTDGEIMGIRHRRYAIEGVQFHPESFLTPDGPSIVRNFVRRTQNKLPQENMDAG